MIINKWYSLEFDNGQKLVGRCVEKSHHHIALEVDSKYRVFTLINVKGFNDVGDHEPINSKALA